MTVDSVVGSVRSAGLPAETRATGGPGEGHPAEIRWTAVCPYSRLAPGRGVAALIGGAQVAIIRTHEGRVFAVSHRDPVSGAHVMSRGLLGHHDDQPTIASPDRRHVYDLVTGECLDLPGIRLPVYPVRRRGDLIEVGVYTARPAAAHQAGAHQAAVHRAVAR